MAKSEKKSSSRGKSKKSSKTLKRAPSAKASTKHERNHGVGAAKSKAEKPKNKASKDSARLLKQHIESIRDHIGAALGESELRTAELFDEVRGKLERLDFAILRVQKQLEKLQSAVSPRPTSNALPRLGLRQQGRQKTQAMPDALRSPSGVLSEGLHTSPIDGDAGRALSGSTQRQPGTKKRE